MEDLDHFLESSAPMIDIAFVLVCGIAIGFTAAHLAALMQKTYSSMESVE
jgi:hypothetical protein